MRFRDVKRRAIHCLTEGAYDHQTRGNIDVKNLFATGQVSEAWVIDLIGGTSSEHYQCSPHHQDSSIDVHIFKPWRLGQRWYVKFFFLEPDIIFISVHICTAGERS
ncbi:hypothetical protein CQW29_04790 [Pantoea coffeiphila]|uniref:Uncharacterized protein n=1 Tax=Pantoea coffeiphila TaxID=1465635 RepID=A0A2S9IGZ4_9GAMM|nr:hypothetical protein CQW29_04790 [Pantoea coffeiphila]